MTSDHGFSLGFITTDSTDPGQLARWWAELLGGEIATDNDGWFYIVPTPVVTLAFQKVDAVTPGKNRIHLDLGVRDDLRGHVDRVIAAGGMLVAEHQEDHGHWFTLADPQGNQFCLAEGHSEADSSE